jgi:radical SAM protein with 4Fe4S-binding SPASM domain
VPKTIVYRNFRSAIQAKAASGRHPSCCQIELTYGCDYHCQHCYAACYNNKEEIARELATADVLKIIDRLYEAGVFWLTLTGGDPLTRKDFFQIYEYAVRKGFFVTVFTNGFRISDNTIKSFKKYNPFCIEVTFNASNEALYEQMSGVRGSFRRVKEGIKKIKEAGLRLRIKSMITTANLHDIPRLKKRIESYGLGFNASPLVTARLDGSLEPLKYRISPEAFDYLRPIYSQEDMKKMRLYCSKEANSAIPARRLFRCEACFSTINIDPFGNMFICTYFREKKQDIKKISIAEAYKRLKSFVNTTTFKAKSECRRCSIYEICSNCPGRALLETGDKEKQIDYYCSLAKWQHRLCKKSG